MKRRSDHPLGASRVVPASAVILAVLAGVAPVQADPPDQVQVTGIVRDFREKTEPGGHPDFENEPEFGWARYTGNVDPILGSDRKPVFTGTGWKVAEQYRDSDFRQICYTLYDPARGDNEGQFSMACTGGITSKDTYDLWYRDEPGVNISAPLTITLNREPDGRYVFDDELDPFYAALGGFFPIDGRLFGNSPGGPSHNFHFTYELHMEFDYDAAVGQFFKFVGDEDIWVYIDDRLVIDLSGVHGDHDQYVDLTRLGLVDGQTYKMELFFAERRRTQSNFRVETNIILRNAGLPTITAAFD